MPADSGAAFVIIQHLAPTDASLLTELLAQHTPMKVVQAHDGQPVEPNCVYVIPPNEYLGIRDGVLYLAEPVNQDGIRHAHRLLPGALAEDRQERAVCVLFSGAGSTAPWAAGRPRRRRPDHRPGPADRPIRRHAPQRHRHQAGGLHPAPDRMPRAIIDYLQQPYVRGGAAGSRAAVPGAEAKPGGLDDIMAIVQAKTCCDFRCYKKSTILRRIERRMGLHRIRARPNTASFWPRTPARSPSSSKTC